MNELVASIFSGLSIMVTAVGGIVVLRRRKIEEDERQDVMELRYLRRDNAALKSYNLAATMHMYRLELKLARLGVEPPSRPQELAEDPDLPDRPIRQTYELGEGFGPLPPSGSSGRTIVEGSVVPNDFEGSLGK